MFELEKLYINPKVKQTAKYFSKTLKKGFPLDNNIRYLFSNDLKNVHLLEKAVKDNITRDLNSIVKFLFRIDKYDTLALSRHMKSAMVGKVPFFNLKQKLPQIKKSLMKSNFFIGCVLNQVKGGFIVELNGLVCFMPYSLSDGNRFFPYKPKANAIQLFQPCGLSLVMASKGDVFLNMIVFRNNNEKLLKGLLKRCFGRDDVTLNYPVFTNKQQMIKEVRKNNLRLLSNFRQGKEVKSLQITKEISFPKSF